MTKLIGTLTEPSIIQTKETKQHEHHKIIISVSNFVSNVVLRIEEQVDSSDNVFNLDYLNRDFILTENGDEAFILENQRIDKLQINFVSGDAELKVLYEGW